MVLSRPKSWTFKLRLALQFEMQLCYTHIQTIHFQVIFVLIFWFYIVMFCCGFNSSFRTQCRSSDEDGLAWTF